MILGMRNVGGGRTTSCPTPLVEFIESDGESFINTLVDTQIHFLADYEFSFRNRPNNTCVLFGCYHDRTPPPQVQVVLDSGGYFYNIGCNTDGFYPYEYMTTNKVYRFRTSNYDATTSKAPLYIMARNNDIGEYLPPKYMRLYRFSITDLYADKVIREMLPCLDEKGVPCVWDEISKQYFYNAGTGSFTAGNHI